MRKVTRIILKSVMYLAILILLLATTLLFLVQTSSFQTWLGQKATAYLSEELKTTIAIDKIEIHFFKSAELNGVYIQDKNKDTLLNGAKILVDLNSLDYNSQKINIKNVTVANTTIKLGIEKNDSVMNFQFLVDYFSTGKSKKDTTTKGWDLAFNDLTLENTLCIGCLAKCQLWELSEPNGTIQEYGGST